MKRSKLPSPFASMALPLSVNWCRPSTRVTTVPSTAKVPLPDQSAAGPLPETLISTGGSPGSFRRLARMPPCGSDARMSMSSRFWPGAKSIDASILPARPSLRAMLSCDTTCSGEASARADPFAATDATPPASAGPSAISGRSICFSVDRERQREGAGFLLRLACRLRHPRQFDPLGEDAVGVEGRREQRERRPVDGDVAPDQPRPVLILQHQALQREIARPYAVDAGDLDRPAGRRGKVRNQPGKIVPAALGQRQHGERGDHEGERGIDRVAKDAQEEFYEAASLRTPGRRRHRWRSSDRPDRGSAARRRRSCSGPNGVR